MQSGSQFAVRQGFRVRRERFGCLISTRAEAAPTAARPPARTRRLTSSGSKTVAELVSDVSGTSTPPAPLMDEVLQALNGLERRGIIHEI